MSPPPLLNNILFPSKPSDLAANENGPSLPRMTIILLLILLSLLIAGGFLLAFFWAVGTGQYDDEVTPSMRILFEDPKPTNNDDNVG